MSGRRGRKTSYSSAGVDYVSLDAGKRLALAGALATSDLLSERGGRAVDDSRGEPAFVFEFAGQTFAFVLEGLGTKSVIARQVADELGDDYFRAVAYDAVAAIVNDLCCVGALPLVVNAYFATGSSDWYLHAERHASLIAGWQQACTDAGATWGGGESPSLPELVGARDIELAGSAIGALPAGQPPILGQNLSAGDEIVFVESSGLHANGASLARLLVDRLDRRYATALPNGIPFGQALLEPSIMYARLVGAVWSAALPVTYYSHITGHGLLKLMRPKKELTYRITDLPAVPEVLKFLVSKANMSHHAAYSTFNMGCGYAVYCRSGSGDDVVALAQSLGYRALVAGHVEQGPRKVVLAPLNIEFAGDEMDLTPSRTA